MVRFKTTDNLYEYTDIEVFDMVRSGALHTFPRDFWNGINALESAKEITKHLFEKILKWSIEDIKINPLSEAFYDNRLGSMLKNLFENNVYKAIANAYPELAEWAEINRKQMSSGYSGNSSDKNNKSYSRNMTFYTDEELIEKLQNKANKLCRNPIGREMEDPNSSTYANRFGSWEKALIAAGLTEDIYNDIDTSEDIKIKADKQLKDFVLKNDRLPSKEEVLDIITEGQMKTFFNSYATLCDYLQKNYTNDELIDILKYKYKALCRLPVGKELKFPRAIVFIDAFGSLSNAFKEAGLI